MQHPLIKIYDTAILDDDICRQAIELPYYHGRQDLPAPNLEDVDLRGTYYTHDFYSVDHHGSKPFDQCSGHHLYQWVLDRLELCSHVPVPARNLLYGAYMNVLKHGDAPRIHCDAPSWVDNQCTMIVYFNQKWHPNYGGETIFYDDKLDIVHAVVSKPGRVVIFDGRIPHSARPPTPYFLWNRYMMAFKFMGIEQRNELLDIASKLKHPYTEDDLGVAGMNPSKVKELMYEQTLLFWTK